MTLFILPAPSKMFSGGAGALGHGILAFALPNPLQIDRV
jgi:hypothetical protein